MLNGQFLTLSNERGFDCNNILTPATAAIMKLAKYDFVMRYVPRFGVNVQDLTGHEANDILYAGLGLGVVQHVAPENWTASESLGTDYGTYAAVMVAKIGLPPGSIIWCDLEGVAAESHQQVIDFYRAWAKAVGHGGYVAGLYVGWHCGLTPDELYSLPTQHYWGAYNVDAIPSKRGFQMRQQVQVRVPGVPFYIDPDMAMPDHLGGRAVVFHK